MPRKKKSRRRAGWKTHVSRGMQTALALFPEIRAVSETYQLGDWTKLPANVVYNRMGYDYTTKTWDTDRAIANNAISIGGPLLIRWAMKGVR